MPKKKTFDPVNLPRRKPIGEAWTGEEQRGPTTLREIRSWREAFYQQYVEKAYTSTRAGAKKAAFQPIETSLNQSTDSQGERKKEAGI